LSPLFVKVALSGDNLRKVLLINTPINNAQGPSVLFGLLFGLEDTPLTPIQVSVLQLDLRRDVLGFVAAVEPAEDGIMISSASCR
jgi:hypothetical protein